MDTMGETLSRTTLPSCCWRLLDTDQAATESDVYERLCDMNCKHEHHQTTDNDGGVQLTC